MKKSIETMRTENGYFEINGQEYILTEQAAFQSDPIQAINDWAFNNYYSARAICPDDEIDKGGYQKCYMVRWEILDSYDPEWDGEDCACDWDSPAEIRVQGEYNAETGRYY